MMTRDETIRSMFDTSGFGLEIGPSYNPLLPKSQGYNVETVDHASADELRQKYKSMDGAADRIEEVDYISDGSPLTEVIGEKARYDFIVASHVIEHVPDLVRFLQDCQSLLKEDGTLVLAVPDKRYCFDTFRPLTSIGGVLQAYEERRTRHSTATIFDYLFHYAKRGEQDVWIEPDRQGLRLVHSASETMKRTEAAGASNGYTDAHAWVFVPESFAFIIDALRSLALVNFRVDKNTAYDGPTFKHEFYVVLKKSLAPADLGEPRLRKIERELAEISPA